MKPPADDADDPSRGGRFILKQSKKTKRMAAANLEPTYEMLDELALVGIKLTDEGFLQPQVRVVGHAVLGLINSPPLRRTNNHSTCERDERSRNSARLRIRGLIRMARLRFVSWGERRTSPPRKRNSDPPPRTTRCKSSTSFLPPLFSCRTTVALSPGRQASASNMSRPRWRSR